MTLDSLFSLFLRGFGRVRTWVLAHKRVSGAMLVLIIAAFLVFGGNGEGGIKTVTIAPKSFVQEVSVSGKVQAANDVSMRFEQTGRVERVYVSVGEEVTQGSPLIALSSGTLSAQLLSAQAEVTKRRVERDNRAVNLEEITKQQDTKVASAYRTLLSTDLEAEPEYSSYTVTAPIITGAYQGMEEGVYKFRLEQKNNGTDDVSLYVFGIETTGAVTANRTGGTPLGTLGLYVSFPDDLRDYNDTIWYVEVPNTKSASYATNLNAYQEALRERDKQIADAEAELTKRSQGQTIADAALLAAEAEVARILAELSKYTLRAPFSGLVTRVDAEIGETVSSTDAAVSIISTDGLEIESFVPEINISLVAVGDRAAITLDAYGEEVVFIGTVGAIDPAETIRDGVSTYKVTLNFAEEDERVKSGMTANILITTDEREGVISVPQGVVKEEKGQKSVPLLRSGKTEYVPVTTGSISSLGEIEITSGLKEGDVLILSGA